MEATRIVQCSAGKLAAAIRAGETSAEAATEAYLARIEALDPRLGCYLAYDAEAALTAARSVDRAPHRGAALAGVPVALKDNLVCAGLPTTCGSKILEGWRPPYEGTAVTKLRAAGAVILGKLNMDEFAMGSSTENSAYGPCRNPWDRRRVPGGSSGGSAAAVAADLCAASLGTDTGGSIRQPAALCGAVGIKPTYGRVSRYGVIAFASSLDQVGPLTKTVRDAALLLQVIGGHDPADSTSASASPAAYAAACERGVQGLRVGVPAEYFVEGLDPAVERLVRGAITQLEQLGAHAVEVQLPHTRYAIATYHLIATAEACSNLARYDGVRYGLRAGTPDAGLAAMYAHTRSRGFGAEVIRRIMLGTFALSAGYSDAYYAKAQRVRTLIRQDFEAAFARCDVIATPTSPVPAFLLGERANDPLQMYLADVYTLAGNLAGLPGLSLPCGFTAAPVLPVGLQLLGPPLGEEAVFAAAAAYEDATQWRLQRPPLGQAGA